MYPISNLVFYIRLSKIRDRIQVLEHVSYQSSKGSFTAQPGAAGSHLNCYGPVNQHFFAVRDALDQKKGISFRGTFGTIRSDPAVCIDHLINAHEAKRLLKTVSAQKLYYHCSKGHLPFIRQAGKLYFLSDSSPALAQEG